MLESQLKWALEGPRRVFGRENPPCLEVFIMEGIGAKRSSGKPSLEGKVEDPRPNQDGVLADVDLPVSKHPSLQVAGLKDLKFSGGNLDRPFQVSARMLDAGGEAPARGGASTARLGASQRSPRPILGHLADAATSSRLLAFSAARSPSVSP